ncbi:aspartyl-tRNA(Asn)/glutamyl-tRNA(Gln) amidotransferase subunit A [Pseudonocardia thermophila]|uniref:Aspartyl-tRNA(Asn)/glutamyl-tRNA(Gln) amidotransferase subunit A n=1 Tax=Pseudonocardia thermophila TaxID=1848 RepID=A0A1M6S114_PSETH|nr:amidase [Pseudonocardia thermophila]SHK38512.1 aspartyl-tRNA(Asn)/glutamyl-tRNA(Gln) amidotransferase subunit A [Pseudonocardia thermophila]
MAESDVCWLGIADLVTAYRARRLSPVEVTRTFLDRIERLDGALHSFLTVTDELALSQAAAAERCYAAGGPTPPLLGVPVSIKDAFHVEGVVTTLGSVVHRDHVAKNDSGVVRRLRAAGAVFTGKTNTAEFGQSATTDNLLGPDTANPWDPARTPGGSSGGAAASVAAGLSTVAVGSDGGGSIRIPAAFTGLYGLKPSPGVCPDEKGFRAMTDFTSPGPLAARVADARVLFSVLAGSTHPRRPVSAPLRIRYCPNPEGRPVEAEVAAAVEHAVTTLAELGHDVVEGDLPVEGWNDVFGPLVLDDEHRERGHLLGHAAQHLTRYERSSLRAAEALDPAVVRRAHELLPIYRRRIDALFADHDVLVTPTTAVAAFPLRERPTSVGGVPVDTLWGAFPFAVPFNVAGVAAASLPCGLVDGLPVGVQLVTRAGAEQLLLDVSEDLEEALAFDRAPVKARWTLDHAGSAG